MSPIEMRQQMKKSKKSLDEIADQFGGQSAGTPYYRAAMAEFMFRQADAQEKATDAQCKAAAATQATAEFTKSSAKYILWGFFANLALVFVTAASVFLHRWLN